MHSRTRHRGHRGGSDAGAGTRRGQGRAQRGGPHHFGRDAVECQVEPVARDGEVLLADVIVVLVEEDWTSEGAFLRREGSGDEKGRR